MQLKDLPPTGQPLDGGLFAGLTTAADGTHSAVVLLEAKPTERLTWADAKRWAAEVRGSLPTRPVAAILFANVKSQFEEDWHWTADAYGASYAWGCDFSSGYQFSTRKSYEGCARAVRLIPLTV